uniref:Tetraspanin n=1 Tax=Ciona savignyi TaxID=51511 RepID=H2ZHQ7_CIOSA
MKAKCKPTYFFFCFHPRFDTGTWSIAGSFACAVVFAAMFVMSLSYSAPKCICSQIWEHIDILPTVYKVLYVLILLYFAALLVTSTLAIYGTFNAQYKKLPPFIIMMIFTELATFGASIYIFVQLAYIDQYLLFDNDTYWNMAKMVLKEDLVTNLEQMMSTVSILLKQFLNLDMGESLNLDMLMDAALKDGVLVVLGGMKRMMKFSAILMLLGINSFFITCIMVMASHYKRLKGGKLRTYSGVPSLVIHKGVLSTSARSTASDSLSDDCSGTPLKQIKRMRSSDYSNSPRSIKRLYNLNSLDVEKQFPKGDVL